ncbi:ADP-ribosylation factor-like protein 14 [Hippocampus zosterae]|uniref:ADP-ribosylation factor-like protein 14 n=1 Tax=Hippocampus zosterae TaxID=109293 RepID=UPI00223DFA3E|nr:ADP-ribosylation factor-like protein 14 [Hippocampus zosterae]
MGMNGSKSRGQVHVLMLGLDQSGKSTLLYKLKYNKSVVTVPTVGFNVETLETDRRSPSLTVWDVGGQRKMRPHWEHHYADAAGLMFVVDSADQGRLDEARKELHRMLKFESLRGVPLVILSNKQDLRGALSSEAVCQRLDLRQACEGGRPWFIQPCSGITGMGLEEGFRKMVYLIKTPLRQTQHDIQVKMKLKGFRITALLCG